MQGDREDFDRRLSIAFLSGQVSQGQNKRLGDPWLPPARVLGLPEDTLERLTRFLFKDCECKILSARELKNSTRATSGFRVGAGEARL